MVNMDWEQKLAALQSLCKTSLKMRKPGDWYVMAHRREVKEGALLASVYGNGATPQEAVENDWLAVTRLPENHYIVLNAGEKTRRAVRWNGFMWEDVQE